MPSGPCGALIDFSAGTLEEAQEKKSRHRMTDLQLSRLEALYERTTHPNRTEKQTLSNDVGMSFKTVNIWFQNKRQTARRRHAAASIPPTASAVCIDTQYNSPVSACAPSAARPPLATVSHGGNALDLPLPQVHPKPAAGKVTVPPAELWTYLLSSPPSSPGRAALGFRHWAPSVSPAPPTPPRAAALRSTAGCTGGAESGKRPRILEWACARAEKRRRVAGGDEDGSSGLGGSDTPDETNLRAQVVSMGKTDHRPSARSRTPPGLAQTPATARPQGYSTAFSPDVILGASLLLTFKHSMDSA
ncbi:hypothetical protein B0H21DRAFT_695671 [Amylocystis lapponica]|nr:hypothetical protein B0H21DRAFT_695671 [Amylocystis lapponica]